jgi:YgiT-type zinc finger domain-containing protein
MDQLVTKSTGAAATHAGAEAAPLEAASGTCPACGSKVEAATVITALWEGDALSVVRNVPALVCRGCQERYFADDTVMRLDLMRAGRFASETPIAQMTVPVFAFPAIGGGQA